MVTQGNYTFLTASDWYAVGETFNATINTAAGGTTELEYDYQALVPLIISKMEHNHAAEMMWQTILNQSTSRVKPFIIGLTGSVAVGKSTAANTLKKLLAVALPEAQIEIVTTDNFLYSNSILMAKDLMDRKGFPESYDTAAMISFMQAVKERQANIQVPVYSHEYYDILPDQVQMIKQPDIVILEGVNALHRAGQALAPIDLMDLTIYLDADLDLLTTWFMTRFERLVDQAKTEPTSYYHQFVNNRPAASELALDVWHRVNEANLLECILPTRELADIIIKKGPNHLVTEVALRKY